MAPTADTTIVKTGAPVSARTCHATYTRYRWSSRPRRSCATPSSPDDTRKLFIVSLVSKTPDPVNISTPLGGTPAIVDRSLVLAYKTTHSWDLPPSRVPAGSSPLNCWEKGQVPAHASHTPYRSMLIRAQYIQLLFPYHTVLCYCSVLRAAYRTTVCTVVICDLRVTARYIKMPLLST